MLSELWRGQLHELLEELDGLWQRIEVVEKKFDELAKADPATRLLETTPGVGRRTAEAVAVYLDDPKRFNNGREVSAYSGLVPRQYQSGEVDRRGRITRRGPSLLRKLLVEAAWCMLRYNAWARQIVARISRGQRTRKKQAIIALARTKCPETRIVDGNPMLAKTEGQHDEQATGRASVQDFAEHPCQRRGGVHCHPPRPPG